MTQTALLLETLIDEYKPLLLSIPEEKLLPRPAPGKWSRKEIIGHLADSAESNIRRFVVAQYENTPFIVYNQDKWVQLVNYQEWNKAELIELWYLLNKQVVHILRDMPAENAERTCQTQALHSIAWLAEDYIKYLRHHMHVVLEREPVAYP